MTIQVSNSEIACHLRCPRRWFATYYLGVQPASEPATGNRQLGIRVHAALQGWRGYDLDPLAVLVTLYRIEADRHPDAAAELRAEEGLARVMVEGYIEWLAEEGKDAGLEFVSAEEEVTVPLPSVQGVELRAKLDARVRDEDGHELFLDYKTADSFERHETLALDPQFKFYSLVQALRRQADPSQPLVMGGMVDTLRRVKRTAKSNPPYYMRDLFRYSPADLTATARKVTGVAKRIVADRQDLDELYARTGGDLDAVNAWQQENFPPNEMPRDCSWSCPLVTLCPMMNDGSDWPGVITDSGRFTQGDPYSYYSSDNDPIRSIRAELAAHGGEVATGA